MRFEWDERKGTQNLAKHDVDFQTAELVFDDPSAVTIRDLAHEGEEVIRLISARAATSKERRSYEEAHKKPGAPNRRHRREKGRRH